MFGIGALELLILLGLVVGVLLVLALLLRSGRR